MQNSKTVTYNIYRRLYKTVDYIYVDVKKVRQFVIKIQFSQVFLHKHNNMNIMHLYIFIDFPRVKAIT